MLSVSDFPDGWQRTDEVNDNFDAVFQNEDETIVVFVLIAIHDTVEAAKEDYETSLNSFRDPQEMDFADEAFWDTQNDEAAYCIFQDSNVEGQTASMRLSGGEPIPDQSRAQKYARTMHENWQEL